MPKGNQKGSSFERRICTTISKWWSSGRREDLFWRSSQSGGRATTSLKSGKVLFNAAGDIAAMDPSAFPFLQFFTPELKRGYSKASIADIMDALHGAKTQVYEEWMKQALASARIAKSVSWMIIHQRDRREATVTLPAMVFSDTLIPSKVLNESNCNIIRFRIENKNDPSRSRTVLQFKLDDFFMTVKPSHIYEALKRK